MAGAGGAGGANPASLFYSDVVLENFPNGSVIQQIFFVLFLNDTPKTMSRFDLASLCCVSFFWAVVLCFYSLGHILKYCVLTLFYTFTSSPVSTVCFHICGVSVCASPVWLCIIIVAQQQMVSPCASCPPALAFPPSMLCSSVPQCLF